MDMGVNVDAVMSVDSDVDDVGMNVGVYADVGGVMCAGVVDGDVECDYGCGCVCCGWR